VHFFQKFYTDASSRWTSRNDSRVFIASYHFVVFVFSETFVSVSYFEKLFKVVLYSLSLYDQVSPQNSPVADYS